VLTIHAWEGLLGLVTAEAGRVRAFEVRSIRLDEGRQAEYGDDLAFREKRGFSDLAAGEQGRRISGASPSCHGAMAHASA
jgi:hypothetical protein